MGSAAISAAASKRSTWGQILIIGDEEEGRHPSRSMAELYDPASGRFAAHLPLMDHGRYEATATVIRVGSNAGKVLVAGGSGSWEYGKHTGNGIVPLASTELYDPATNTFAPGPAMHGAGATVAVQLPSAPPPQ